MTLRWGLIVTLALLVVGAGPAAADEEAWAALRQGGTVALLRHARAPGVGDPANFVLEDCATQRNLSDGGRAQARGIGESFRSRNVEVGRVLSSAWCRALETARLAFGRAEPFAPLNSFFQSREDEPEQTAALRAAIAGWQGPGVLALVTHQVNITALTRRAPQEGEILVLRPTGGDFRIVGTIPAATP